MKKKKVCVITGSRSEFGLLRPIIDRIIQSKKLSLSLIVCGMHLAKEYGYSLDDIINMGYHVDATVDMQFSSHNTSSMAKGLGVGIYGIAQSLEQLRPDICLVLGDRVEAFAGACACALSGIALAHIHGGEVTRGGFDESMRHAITKLAHIHFAATEENRQRIIKMGENPNCVFTVGAPGIDAIVNGEISSKAHLQKKLGLSLSQEYALLVEHPVSTQAQNARRQIKTTLKALKANKFPIIAVYPNTDAGSFAIVEELEKAASAGEITLFKNLTRADYLGLLKHCSFLIGNSSSGIIESSLFKIPVVNIGIRQEKRTRATNVVDAKHTVANITRAIAKVLSDKAFRKRLKECTCPYGNGNAGEKVVAHLEKIEITADLLQKQIRY